MAECRTLALFLTFAERAKRNSLDDESGGLKRCAGNVVPATYNHTAGPAGWSPSHSDVPIILSEKFDTRSGQSTEILHLPVSRRAVLTCGLTTLKAPSGITRRTKERRWQHLHRTILGGRRLGPSISCASRLFTGTCVGQVPAIAGVMP